MIVQGLNPMRSSFLQLPHFRQETFKKMKSHLKNLPNRIEWFIDHNLDHEAGITIKDYCRLTPAERKDMNMFSEKELEDVEKAIKRMPLIKVEARGYVKDSDEITTSSMIQIEVKVTFENFTA
jgi:hypothetical protein